MAKSSVEKHQPIILVTGAAGFLGSAIVRELLDPGCPFEPKEIRVFDIRPYTGLSNGKIIPIIGDIRDIKAVRDAVKGVDLVIHAAAIIDWGTKSRKEVMSVNYGGTENVVNACMQNNVRNLVYTSSLDAVYRGKPLVNVDETLAYPHRHKTSYCESKYLAEKLVASSNNGYLKTVILRPSDIYGEGDPYHIGSLVAMAKTGFYIRLGNGKAKCQHVYVGNMAHAHVLAANALLESNNRVFGQIYFITDGPATNFFRFFDQFITGAGYKFFPRNLWLPRWLAFPMASISELIAWLARPVKKYTPKFSRFAVTYTCTDFTFNSQKAKSDFGFAPKYSEREAKERTIDAVKALPRNK